MPQPWARGNPFTPCAGSQAIGLRQQLGLRQCVPVNRNQHGLRHPKSPGISRNLPDRAKSHVVQADAFNRSRLRTVIGVALSSNTRLLDAPGNVLLQAVSTGLPRDSVANVTQLLTIDEDYLTDRAGQVSRRLMARVENGLRLVLAL